MSSSLLSLSVKKVIAGIILAPALLFLGVALFTLMNFFASIVLFLLTLGIMAAVGLVAWALIEEKYLDGSGSNVVIIRGEDDSGIIEVNPDRS